MAPQPLSCPYCNAYVTPPAHAVPGQRIPCPRCGEMFAYRPADDAVPLLPPSELGPIPTLPVPTPRWSNRAVALTLLAVMGGMAVLGLTFAQMTTALRRAQDVHPVADQPLVVPVLARAARLIYLAALGSFLLSVTLKRVRSPLVRIGAGLVLAVLALIAVEDTLGLFGRSVLIPPRWRQPEYTETTSTPAAVEAVAPSQLAGLGYLPADTSFLVGLHVAEALREDAGRELLANLRLGSNRFSLDQLEKRTGLDRDQIDHVVLGLKLALPPRVTLIVRTRQPYDEAKLRTALQAERKTERKQKTLYRFPWDQLEFTLWAADRETFIVGLSPQDFDDVPATPAAGGEHLPAEFQPILKERLRPGTPVWVVARAEAWDRPEGQMLLTLAEVPKEERDVLAVVKTVGLWLRLDPGRTLNGAVEAADEAKAAKVDAYVKQCAAEGKGPFRLLTPRQDGAAAKGEAVRSLVVAQRGVWVDAQARLPKLQAAAPSKSP